MLCWIRCTPYSNWKGVCLRLSATVPKDYRRPVFLAYLCCFSFNNGTIGVSGTRECVATDQHTCSRGEGDTIGCLLQATPYSAETSSVGFHMFYGRQEGRSPRPIWKRQGMLSESFYIMKCADVIMFQEFITSANCIPCYHRRVAKC